MSRARDFADLAGSADAGGLTGKNKFINGSFLVAQRGTSSTSNGYVSLDRWYANQSGGSTTFSQETNSNPSETGGLQKYARLNVSTSSDFTSIRQPIEDVASVPAGTYTLSFWAKGTAPTGGLYVWGTQDFGSSGSSDVSITNELITSTLTSSWVRYTKQITIPSIDGKTIGAGSYVLINIGQYSNTGTTAYDLNIAGVQLEVGEQATPFEHRSYGDELARCQRYYHQRPTGATTGGVPLTEGGVVFSSTAGLVTVQPPVEMRAVPSFSYAGSPTLVTGGAAPSISAISLDAFSKDMFRLSATSSSLTTGQGTYIQNVAGNSVFLKFDAEL